jgi:phosphate uptake regulator
VEIRRVQLTGGSSFVITLPKEWAQAQNIKKNDPLGLIVQPDSTLLVVRDITEGQVIRTKEFDVGTITEPAYLFRLLIGAYINGFNIIKIRSNQRLPPFVPGVVRDFTQMTIGQQVVEETENSITLKDLLNPSEMPFENTIKRMYVIVKTMHQGAIEAISTRNQDLAENIMARDNDVDRLNWLIARQANMLMRNTNLSRKMGIPVHEAIDYQLISRIMERIADHAVRIMENAKPVISRETDPGLINQIRKASALSLAIFDRSIISLFNRDMKASHRNIESLSELETICEEIEGQVLTLDIPVAISVGYIAESIRRSGEYAADISEIVINHIVEHEQTG